MSLTNGISIVAYHDLGSEHKVINWNYKKHLGKQHSKLQVYETLKCNSKENSTLSLEM